MKRLVFALVLAGIFVPVVTTHAGSDIVGWASYYSDSFSGQEMACGGTYRPSKMVAASRTVPCGTQLRVINRATGASATVTVSDRGPYGNSATILDLSRGAAAQLGFVQAGRALVEARLVSTPLSAPPSGAASFRFRALEKCFIRRVNVRRTRLNLPRLRWDRQLGYVARLHARAMAQEQRPSHNHRIGARITHWVSLGENVGEGQGCPELSRLFWRSGPHRSNIVGKWRYIGVGVAFRDGQLYVDQLFESWRNPGSV